MTLRQQLQCYADLEGTARQLAEKKSCRVKNPDPMLRYLIEHMSWLKIGRKNHSTRIADMVIQGNTQGMVKTLRDVHRFPCRDPEIRALGQQLLSCELAHIRQMQPFL